MLSYRSSKTLNKGPHMLRNFRDNVNKLVKNMMVIWEERGYVPFTAEDKIRATLDKLFSDLVKVFRPMEKMLKSPLVENRPKTERYRSPLKSKNESIFFTSRRKLDFPDFTPEKIEKQNQPNRSLKSLERYLTPIPKKSGHSFGTRSFSSRKKNPLEGSPYSKLYPEEDESVQLDFSVPLPRVEIVNSFAFRAKRYHLRGGRGKKLKF